MPGFVRVALVPCVELWNPFYARVRPSQGVSPLNAPNGEYGLSGGEQRTLQNVMEDQWLLAPDRHSTAFDIADAACDIAAEGERVDPAGLAAVSPYITHTVRRFGNWTLNLTPPDRAPTTRPDLEPRVLFAPA